MLFSIHSLLFNNQYCAGNEAVFVDKLLYKDNPEKYLMEKAEILEDESIEDDVSCWPLACAFAKKTAHSKLNIHKLKPVPLRKPETARKPKGWFAWLFGLKEEAVSSKQKPKRTLPEADEDDEDIEEIPDEYFNNNQLDSDDNLDSKDASMEDKDDVECDNDEDYWYSVNLLGFGSNEKPWYSVTLLSEEFYKENENWYDVELLGSMDDDNDRPWYDLNLLGTESDQQEWYVLDLLGSREEGYVVVCREIDHDERSWYEINFMGNCDNGIKHWYDIDLLDDPTSEIDDDENAFSISLLGNDEGTGRNWYDLDLFSLEEIEEIGEINDDESDDDYIDENMENEIQEEADETITEGVGETEDNSIDEGSYKNSDESLEETNSEDIVSMEDSIVTESADQTTKHAVNPIENDQNTEKPHTTEEIAFTEEVVQAAEEDVPTDNDVGEEIKEEENKTPVDDEVNDESVPEIVNDEPIKSLDEIVDESTGEHIELEAPKLAKKVQETPVIVEQIIVPHKEKVKVEFKILEKSTKKKEIPEPANPAPAAKKDKNEVKPELVATKEKKKEKKETKSMPVATNKQIPKEPEAVEVKHIKKPEQSNTNLLADKRDVVMFICE